MERINYQSLQPTIERGIAEIYQAQRDILENHLYRESVNYFVTRSDGKKYLTNTIVNRIRHNGREIHDRTGNLRRALYNPQYAINTTAESLTITNSIPLQLRFFDMKHLGNWRIYNRQVWGIMYGKVLGQVKWQLYEQVQDMIRQQIINAAP